MAALTQDRNTKTRSADRRSFAVKASTRLFAGSLVAVDANDVAVPMSAATGLKGIGMALSHVDNSSGADGALRVEVACSPARFANSTGGDAITATDIGATCYGVDDQTVALTSGSNSRSPAGTIFDVDDQGVWVKPTGA